MIKPMPIQGFDPAERHPIGAGPFVLSGGSGFFGMARSLQQTLCLFSTIPDMQA
jgi:hypothetical protein